MADAVQFLRTHHIPLDIPLGSTQHYASVPLPGCTEGEGCFDRVEGASEPGSGVNISADNGSTGAELWRTNGTAGGTQLIKDVRPGSMGSYLQNFTAVGSTLFFAANNGASGGKRSVQGAGDAMVKLGTQEWGVGTNAA